MWPVVILGKWWKFGVRENLIILCVWKRMGAGQSSLILIQWYDLDQYWFKWWLGDRAFKHICFHFPRHGGSKQAIHDDVIKWKHFPRYWPFVRGIHRSPVNSPHKGQWRGALMFSLIYAWINDWVNNREAGSLRRYRGHYDVIVMYSRRRCKSTMISYF